MRMTSTEKRILLLAALGTVATMVSGTLVYYSYYHEPLPTVYYYGSENNEHDTEFGGMVEGASVRYGNYCWGGSEDIDELLEANEGDVAISGRGGSATCVYNHPSLYVYPVSGFSNTSEYVEQGNPDSFVISHGAAYGPAIDYCQEAGSLSEAMPLFANHLLELGTILSRDELRATLDASSDEWCEDERGRWGRKVNWEEIMNPTPPPPPEPCPICAALAGGAYYLLLLDD